MNVFRNLTVRIGADTSGLGANMQRAVAQMRQSAQSMSRSMDAVGQSMQSVGQSISFRVTAPLVLLGTQVARTAGDFQAAMIRVQALSNATAVQLDRLTEAARYMGMTTKFTASDAAEALGFMSMAGMRAADSLSALPYVLQLAASAGLDMARSADIITNVMAGYRLGVDELQRANDVLVSTFTATNTSLEQLGEAMKYAGPVASAAGVQFEEAAAMIGLMGNAGIQASMAGTSLRGAISRLLAPTDQIREVMAAAGLQVTDSEGRLRSFVDIVRQLEPRANDAGLMMQLFGQRAGPAMAAVIAQGSTALEALIVRLELADGTAARIADSYNQGLNGAFYSLQSAVEAAGLSLANSGMRDGLENIVRELVKVFRAVSDLNPVWLRMITTIAAAAVAIGPLMIAMGGLLRMFSAVVAVLMGPYGIVALLAGLVIAAVGARAFQSLAAEARGVESALAAAAGPTERLTSLLTQMGNAAGEAREGFRALAEEQVRALTAQAALDEMAANAADDSARQVRNSVGFRLAWGTGAFADFGMSTTPEGQRATELRARATQSRASATAAQNQLFETDFAPQRQAEFERAYRAYVRARGREGFDQDAWMEANPRLARVLRRGPATSVSRSGAAIPEMDLLDLAGVGGPQGMGPPPSVTRAQEIEGLREQAAAVALTANETERLAQIQDVMNEAANAGEAITREQAEAFVDEREALQNTIDSRQEAAEAMERQISANVALRSEVAQSIRDQEELAAAAMQSAEAYERLRVVQDLMRRNPGLSRADAEDMADGIIRSGRALDRATEHMRRMQDLARGVGDAFGQAFERAIMDGEKLGDVLKSLARDVLQLVMRATITQPLANGITNIVNGMLGGGQSGSSGSGGGLGGFLSGIFGGGGSGGFMAQDPNDTTTPSQGGIGAILSGAFGGFFAEGGFLPAGKWGIAGENGPEPIFGGRTGLSVEPNGGGGKTIVYSPTYNFTGTSEEMQQFRREAANDRAQFTSRVKGIVGDMAERGRL